VRYVPVAVYVPSVYPEVFVEVGEDTVLVGTAGVCAVSTVDVTNSLVAVADTVGVGSEEELIDTNTTPLTNSKPTTEATILKVVFEFI
jgi:hypothetical protein